ncbi:MAG: type II CAAX endopeptidase family protein [Peptococcaceae bacterium]|nr:type II CAAX endopeptidase family protein [Peptococcaceae bacterium]
MKNCDAYQKNLGQRTGDGWCALGVFATLMALLLMQGAVYRSTLPTPVLASMNIVVPMLGIALILAVVRYERGAWGEWRLGARWPLAVGCGAIVGLALALALAGSFALAGAHVGLVAPSLASGAILIICVIQEELIFRGYIETRLYGLWHNGWICTTVTAVCFLLSHYPVRWVMQGAVDFSALDGTHVVFILLLHFGCSAVYRRSGCIWAAVALHFCYNLLSGMFVPI